jgi:negative regulator of flagellin synthesis FlgM
MAIDINSINHQQTNGATESAQSATARREPTAPQQETGKPQTGDTVSVTEAAKQLQSLENSLESLPVVDSQRVEAIRTAIANGDYEIDPEKVAEKLMSFEGMLETGE